MSIETENTIPQEICSPWERARSNAVAKPKETLTPEDIVLIKNAHISGYISGESVERTNRRIAADCAVRKIYSPNQDK